LKQLMPPESTVGTDDSSRSRGVLWVRLEGRVGEEQAAAARALVREATGELRAFVIDALAGTFREDEVRDLARGLLEQLRLRGAARGVFITGSATVRMKVAAVAFVAGMSLRFAASREEAWLFLVEQDARPPDPSGRRAS
jgi:hypothetical protein